MKRCWILFVWLAGSVFAMPKNADHVSLDHTRLAARSDIGISGYNFADKGQSKADTETPLPGLTNERIQCVQSPKGVPAAISADVDACQELLAHLGVHLRSRKRPTTRQSLLLWNGQGVKPSTRYQLLPVTWVLRRQWQDRKSNVRRESCRIAIYDPVPSASRKVETLDPSVISERAKQVISACNMDKLNQEMSPLPGRVTLAPFDGKKERIIQNVMEVDGLVYNELADFPKANAIYTQTHGKRHEIIILPDLDSGISDLSLGE